MAELVGLYMRMDKKTRTDMNKCLWHVVPDETQEQFIETAILERIERLRRTNQEGQ